jgi:hypothetical protein
MRSSAKRQIRIYRAGAPLRMPGPEARLPSRALPLVRRPEVRPLAPRAAGAGSSTGASMMASPTTTVGALDIHTTFFAATHSLRGQVGFLSVASSLGQLLDRGTPTRTGLGTARSLRGFYRRDHPFNALVKAKDRTKDRHHGRSQRHRQ